MNTIVGATTPDFSGVVSSVTDQATALLPVVATVGGLGIGIVAAAALWFKFGPSLVKKIFGKAN